MSTNSEGSTGIFIATKTALVNYEGRTIKISKETTRVAADSPLVAAYPQFFKPVDVTFEVENTRQAPRRGGRRARD